MKEWVLDLNNGRRMLNSNVFEQNMVQLLGQEMSESYIDIYIKV